jgi:predicted nucleic acid-binding Zn ribbon protein
MRRSKPVKIGDLWSGFVEESPRLTRGLCEARIPEVWPVLVGAGVASLTVGMEITNGVLTVRLSSSAARHEVFMRREELRVKLNEALGMTVVRVLLVK